VQRLVLLADALNPRAQRSEHPPHLAAALRRQGLEVDLHWISAGLLARLDRRSSRLAASAPLEGAAAQVLASRPEVVVAYDPSSPAAWVGARVARRLGAPLVLVEPAWFLLRKLHERALEEFGRRVWGRLVRSTASTVVAVDPYARERALQRGFDGQRIELIPSGVDTDQFRPGCTSEWVARQRLRGRVLLHVGPLEAGRGLELLIESFARTVGQRSDWTLVLAGEGPLQRRLEAAASRYGVRAGVRFLPHPPLAELPGLLCAATLFLAAAEDERVRGKQVARAMACELPVICSDVPRLAFRVQPEETGCLVTAGDRRAWAAALDRLTGAPGLRAQWGAQGRRVALEHYAWDKVGARFRACLERTRLDALAS
jgi:glycosyltransferase involved in cell wall biosynthesis